MLAQLLPEDEAEAAVDGRGDVGHPCDHGGHDGDGEDTGAERRGVVGGQGVEGAGGDVGGDAGHLKSS